MGETLNKNNIVRTILWLSILLGSILSIASTNEKSGLILEYKITNFDISDKFPHVSLNIRNIKSKSIELIISPMEGFDMIAGSNTSWYYVEKINALSKGQTDLKVIERGQFNLNYAYFRNPIHYRGYSVVTDNQDEIFIEYDLSEKPYVGFLEAMLTRPKNQEDIAETNVIFELNKDWIATTVASKEINTYNLGKLEMMYGNNKELINNYVPYGYAVGKKNEIEIIDTRNGKLIMSKYPDPLSNPLTNRVVQLHAASNMFEYLSEKVGDLSPFNAKVVYLSWPNWISRNIQPGIYSDYWQHNRTIDLSSQDPPYLFYNWKLSNLKTGNTVTDIPTYPFDGFAHQLVRGWWNGGLIRISNSEQPWLKSYGIATYLQEAILSVVYGKHKVYERWNDLYKYYIDSYVNTEKDRPIMNPGQDENTRNFIEKYKSGLWVFYLNQRIIESTKGEKNIFDVIGEIFSEFVGSKKALTLKDIQRIVKVIVGNNEVDDLFTKYLYTNTKLPLDNYFKDTDGDGLLDGLEIELGFDVNLIDSNKNGVNDANEYYSDCMKNVAYTSYCFEVVPEFNQQVQPNKITKPHERF